MKGSRLGSIPRRVTAQADVGARDRRGLVSTIVVVVVAVIAWRVAGNGYAVNIAIIACMYAIVAASWDLTLGYGAMFDFSHAAMFGVGAYACAIVTVDAGWSPWLGLLAGTLAGGASGALVAGTVSRLRGIYVALASFAFAELVDILVTSSSSITGGEQGMVLVPPLQIGSINLSGNATLFLYVMVGVLLVSIVVMRLLVSSSFGLGLRAMRDFEEYARSRGVPVGRHRMWVLVVSSAFAAMAGALFAGYTDVASPDLFGFSTSTLLLTMVILGGVGSIYGPAVGGVVMTVFVNIPAIAELDTGSYLLTSAIILGVLLFIPGGLWSAVSGGYRAVGWRWRWTHPGPGPLRGTR